MFESIFRGKPDAVSDWVYGDLIHRRIASNNILVIRTEDSGFDNYSEYDVVPETVGRYTGIVDKNNNKIFEGDVVSTDLERPYLIVEFRDGCFMFNCNDGEKDYYDIMLPILSEPQTVYKYGEVIGNIYDNNELLHNR